MKVLESFLPTDERYTFDFGPMSARAGWAQIDTHQDASYFGMWTNPHKLKVFSFAEGDAEMRTYDDDDEYVAYLRELKKWDTFIAIDPMCSQPLIDRFGALGVQDLLH